MLLQFTLSADQGRYDELLERSTVLSTVKLISSADQKLENGDEEEALVQYMVVASRPSSDLSPAELEAHVKANLRAGDIHYGKGNYSNALRFYVAALKLSESHPKNPYLPELYKNMGNVYNMFQDFEKGYSLYKTGLKYAEETHDNETHYKLLQNLVGVCIHLNDIAAAREYYEQSQKLEHPVSEEGKYMDDYTLALILKHEGRGSEAVTHFRRLARRASATGIGARYECSAYGEIARIYQQEGKTDSVIYYLTRCKDVAQKNDILYQFAESLKMLYQIYEEMGNTAMATPLKNRYLEMKDSSYNQRQFDSAKNQQFLYEIEKTERQIAELNEREAESARLISRQRLILILAVVILLIVALASYFLYRQKRRLSESYSNLYDIHQRMQSNMRISKEHQTGLMKENALLREKLERESRDRETALDSNQTDNSSIYLKEERGTYAMRYTGSALSEQQRTRLSESIMDVMDGCMPFCAIDFSLNTLAKLVGSNSKYVSQVINDVFKKNFSTFVNEYRVNLACERLADFDNFGNYSMNGIAESVGFKSSATFTTVFKKLVGITPSMYQKMTLEKRNKAAKEGKRQGIS